MDDAGAPRDAGADDAAVEVDAGVDASTTPVGVGDPELVEALEALREAQELPALAAAEFVDGAIEHQAATGTRRWGRDEPVTLADRWHLGSCTKAMTATVAALLVEDGLLGWDTTVGEVLGSRVARPIDPAFDGVTLRMLMSHRAGFATDMSTYPEGSAILADDAGAPDAVRLAYSEVVLSRAPALTPGGQFQYSNIGYIVAGAMMEQLTGQTWESLMTSRLFEPLGMVGCGFGVQATDAVEAPWPHLDESPPTPVLADNPPGLGPAGTVFCPLQAWGRFLDLHVTGWRGEPTPILQPASFDVLHSGPMLGAPLPEGDYAQGWSLTTRAWAGGPVLTHSGSNTWNYAVVWLAPSLDRFIVAVANRGGDAGAQGTDMALGELIDRYY